MILTIFSNHKIKFSLILFHTILSNVFKTESLREYFITTYIEPNQKKETHKYVIYPSLTFYNYL